MHLNTALNTKFKAHLAASEITLGHDATYQVRMKNVARYWLVGGMQVRRVKRSKALIDFILCRC